MTEIFKAIFLGVVQGFTEFLPVSSSAHLNIMPWFFDWTITESFDLALHAGTLLAILVFFFKDWVELVCGGVLLVLKKEKSDAGRLFWYIVIATVPSGIIGKLIENVVESVIDGNLNIEMMVISAALIIMGVLLYAVDSKAKATTKLNEMKFWDSFIIGFSQALAGAIPGVSRSGITMTVARAKGLDRESAAKYSFLLSAPMVGGAILVTLVKGEFVIDIPFFVGIAASFISGIFVIKFLMSFLKKGSFKGFGIYRVIFGLFVFAVAFFRLTR